MKLSDLRKALKVYDSHVMRESVRMVHRAVIRESKVPQTGVYWWAPKPVGVGEMEWDIVPFYNHDYGETLHVDQWSELLELLAIWWKRDVNVLKRVVGDNYCALPRGRVS